MSRAFLLIRPAPIFLAVFISVIKILITMTETTVYVKPKSYECGNSLATVSESHLTNEISLSSILKVMKCRAIKWKL